MKIGVRLWKMKLIRSRKNDSWELVPRPKNKNIIGVKWIYKLKYNVDGSIAKHKTQLVAKFYV